MKKEKKKEEPKGWRGDTQAIIQNSDMGDLVNTGFPEDINHRTKMLGNINPFQALSVNTIFAVNRMQIVPVECRDVAAEVLVTSVSVFARGRDDLVNYGNGMNEKQTDGGKSLAQAFTSMFKGKDKII